MKKQIAKFSILLTLLTGGYALAQDDGWDIKSDYNQLYNTETVTTLSGEILSIDRDMVLEPGMAPGVVAVLETDQGLVNVHVGPQWFAKFYRDKFDLKVGDEVEVTGSIIDYHNSKTMILRAGQKNDQRMVIRDTDGEPVWDPEVETELF